MARYGFRRSMLHGLLFMAGFGVTACVGAAEFSAAKVVTLKNGLNSLSLGGQKMAIIMADRPNGNAHGFTVTSFYATSDGWTIMPVFRDSKQGQDEQFNVKRGGGADCVLFDFRLLTMDGKVKLILAKRDFGQSFADDAAVHFDVYRLESGHEDDVGRPPSYFEFERSIAARKAYCDVGEAFRQELGLGDYLEQANP
ncbi:carbapenem self-resistance protein CarG family protein [Dyella sp.]|uniref:carbapenem self-resistance protein CarG family protein n=1 Tax=Dyella sp. TaxID=1869338 RepID=UPI002ED6898F